MPFDLKNRETRAQRAQRFIARSDARMNNTKWREVFRCIARHGLSFQLAWVRDSDWNTQVLQPPIRESLIDDSGLRDPGVGGPFFYREILWLRFPRMRQWTTGGGAKKLTPQNIEPFLDELRGLGSLPLTITTDHVEITGYQKP